MNKVSVFSIFLSACLVTACATTGTDDAEFKGDHAKDVRAVVATPVNDVGLMSIEIPDYLISLTNPYADAPLDCEGLMSEVDSLNQLLGHDLDVPDEEAEAREQRALDATSDTVGSVLIPFRGVVRFISGASANEREAREAYERGLVRRAYLKGLSDERSC